MKTIKGWRWPWQVKKKFEYKLWDENVVVQLKCKKDWCRGVFFALESEPVKYCPHCGYGNVKRNRTRYRLILEDVVYDE